jgi:hypothetical protein
MSPRRAGPTPYLRLDLFTKATQGQAVYLSVMADGLSLRQAAAVHGLTVTTAWRRYWWFADWTLPNRYGVKASRLPPQRGTRACPRGRPWIKELDDVGGPLHRGGIR